MKCKGAGDLRVLVCPEEAGRKLHPSKPFLCRRRTRGSGLLCTHTLVLLLLRVVFQVVLQRVLQRVLQVLWLPQHGLPQALCWQLPCWPAARPETPMQHHIFLAYSPSSFTCAPHHTGKQLPLHPHAATTTAAAVVATVVGCRLSTVAWGANAAAVAAAAAAGRQQGDAGHRGKLAAAAAVAGRK